MIEWETKPEIQKSKLGLKPAWRGSTVSIGNRHSAIGNEGQESLGTGNSTIDNRRSAIGNPSGFFVRPPVPGALNVALVAGPMYDPLYELIPEFEHKTGRRVHVAA